MEEKKMPIIDQGIFKNALPYICDKETSADPEGWTDSNPLWGHCAVVALIAQNIFGGKILRASLKHTEFAAMRSHYANEFPGHDIPVDISKAQFGTRYPPDLCFRPRDREELLSDQKTKKRYKLLCYRFGQFVNHNSKIFDDPIYRACFFAALGSPCKKKKFGSVVTHNGATVYEGCNKTIEPLGFLCERGCIRFSIASRTESMIGACGHAEEQALWEIVKKQIPLGECDLYIAGLDEGCLPWIKKEAEHTCLRCSVQMYHAGIRKVYVPCVDGWVGLTPEQCVQTAQAYVLKIKKV